ncbi:MAG: hypothetical protein ABI270_07980 [Nitrosospira sp.]
MNDGIDSLLKEGFERELFASLHQGLNDLHNKLRLNNFAYGMQELMRHILRRLAPDDSVIKCSWYKHEPNKPMVVSRRQRACFAVQGGLSDEYVRDILKLETESMYTALICTIDRLSKFTHIEEKVFGLAEAEVAAKVRETEEAFAAFCSTIWSCRAEIIDALWLQIDEAVVGKTLNTIEAIDEIATHHSIEEIYTSD